MGIRDRVPSRFADESRNGIHAANRDSAKTGFGETGFGETGFDEIGFGETGFGETGFGETGFGETGFGETDGHPGIRDRSLRCCVCCSVGGYGIGYYVLVLPPWYRQCNVYLVSVCPESFAALFRVFGRLPRRMSEWHAVKACLKEANVY